MQRRISCFLVKDSKPSITTACSHVTVQLYQLAFSNQRPPRKIHLPTPLNNTSVISFVFYILYFPHGYFLPNTCWSVVVLPEYSTITYCNYSKISVAIVIIEPHRRCNRNNHCNDHNIYIWSVPSPFKLYVHLYDN